MKSVQEVIETTIRNHPLLDFEDRERDSVWCGCPCGFSTPHVKSSALASQLFQDHVAEEINDELVEGGFLAPSPAPEPPRRVSRRGLPVDHLTPAPPPTYDFKRLTLVR